MLLHRKFLIKVSKFRGHKFENRLTGPFDVTSFRYSNSPKIKFLNDRETNGCQISFPLYKKLSSVRYGFNISQFLEKNCWKCKQPLKLKKFSCALCGALQHPEPNINYFQLLGISQIYDVDLEDLKKKFINLQMMFHPDKFANKSKEELEISEAYSTLLNKAYTLLKNPVARGYYLLDLQKVPSEAFPLKQEFLINIMEKNEDLEALENSCELEKFLKQNQESITEHLQLIKDAFRANHVDNVRLNLTKLNYYIQLENKIKEKQHKMDPSVK